MIVRGLVRHLIACILLGVFLGLTACHRDDPIPIPPEAFTKIQQEQLGDLLSQAIAWDTDRFHILPHKAPYDTTVYWLVQRLYDQATNLMRIDHQSPTENRWSKKRPWKVHILVNSGLNAFVLPGGAFYITTGLLKALEEEYELYYILSFEAALMNEGLLLERMSAEINTTKLLNLVEQNYSAEDIDVLKAAIIFSMLAFEEEEVRQNDAYTLNAICKTSQWSRFGLIPLLDSYGGSDENMEWFAYRPFHPDRKEWILNYQTESPEECGNMESNNASGKGYKRYVLDILE